MSCEETENECQGAMVEGWGQSKQHGNTHKEECLLQSHQGLTAVSEMSSLCGHTALRN